MTDHAIIAVYVVIDDFFKQFGQRDHPLAQLTDAEVLTVGVVAALAFHTHHAPALEMPTKRGSLSGTLSASRFNRRLHALRDWLDLLLDTLSDVFRQRAVYLIDSFPVPVCRRVRASRCGQVRGADYCGYCAAKKEKVFG